MQLNDKTVNVILKMKLETIVNMHSSDVFLTFNQIRQIGRLCMTIMTVLIEVEMANDAKEK